MSCRGQEFRKEYSRLGEIRIILSNKVNVMALTATAAKTLRADIIKGIGMKKPIVIAANPDKTNIRYEVVPYVSLNKTFGVLANQLREKHISIGKTIIFCQTLSDCPMIYRFFSKCSRRYVYISTWLSRPLRQQIGRYVP